MSGKPLFGEIRLEQRVLALQKDIGCLRNIRCLENYCRGERAGRPYITYALNFNVEEAFGDLGLGLGLCLLKIW